jgi:hypothetical protein
MAGLFCDTSAPVKDYHPELGTPEVDLPSDRRAAKTRYLETSGLI